MTPGWVRWAQETIYQLRQLAANGGVGVRGVEVGQVYQMGAGKAMSPPQPAPLGGVKEGMSWACAHRAEAQLPSSPSVP